MSFDTRELHAVTEEKYTIPYFGRCGKCGKCNILPSPDARDWASE
jgi:hypothetical protein